MGDSFICHKCEKVISQPFAMSVVEGYRLYFHLSCARGIEGAKQIYIGQPFGQTCPGCEGSGEVAGDYFSDDGMSTCKRCNGKGIL